MCDRIFGQGCRGGEAVLPSSLWEVAPRQRRRRECRGMVFHCTSNLRHSPSHAVRMTAPSGRRPRALRASPCGKAPHSSALRAATFPQGGRFCGRLMAAPTGCSNFLQNLFTFVSIWCILIREQSRRPCVKCCWDGELPDGRRNAFHDGVTAPAVAYGIPSFM